MANKVKTVKVQGGADYAMVVNRVHKFVEDHESHQIHTEIVKDEDGHVIFKAYALIDGVIRGTGHAHELEGSSNINKTSHYEACETSAVGRALAMCGYMPSGQVASYEEVQNAKLQQSQVDLHLKTLDVAVAYTSNAFQTAIENEDEEGILEVIADFRGNHSLKTAVWETLNSEQVQYMNERGKLLAKEAREKSSQKEEANRAFAKEWAAKEKAKELIA